MNPRWLGRFAMLGAPFLFVDFLVNGLGGTYDQNAWSGLYSLLYISGWMCSIAGLWRAEATGSKRWGRLILLVQLFFLVLANVSNVMVLFQIGIHTKLFFILDLFWPISNLWMLVTAVSVLAAKRLRGWMRFVPLIVGLWLPVTLFYFDVILDGTQQSAFFTGAYSTVAWGLMGYVVSTLDSKSALSNHLALS